MPLRRESSVSFDGIAGADRRRFNHFTPRGVKTRKDECSITVWPPTGCGEEPKRGWNMGHHGNEAREALLAAAVELFAEPGLDAFSSRKTAEHVGTHHH